MAAEREGGSPGVGAPIGLLLQVWPHLASHPSVPIGAPTLQMLYPT